MNYYNQIELSDGRTQIDIFGKRPPIGIIIFLIFFCMAGLSVPILAARFAEEIAPFTVLLLIIIFWGTAAILIRMILWNLFGKQTFVFDNSQVLHYFDYRIFKDHRLELAPGKFSISMGSRDEQDGRIVLHHEKGEIISPFKLSADELSEVYEKMKVLCALQETE